MARAHPLSNSREERIAEALQDVDPTTLDLWQELDSLSTHTLIEQIEAPAEGVIIHADNRFSAILNIYVILTYGKDSEEGFTTAESFVAKVSGTLDGDAPSVEISSVDTSAFYE